ncbi:MAG: SsrA-binding protein SmpB [Cyclobacteriaceae bacterium]
MSEFAKTLSIKNRKASFEYIFIDKYTAGVALTGTEVKSVRQSKVNLQHAFCSFHQGELFIKEMHISPYNLASHYNHEATRERKLLLNKNELKKLFGKSKEKGLTIIPTRLFISDRGHIKIDIALAKGKKLFDKREDIKQKDIKRELSRVKF